LITEFKAHILTQFPFIQGKRILVACSGGVDSIVLTKLCKLLKIEIGIAHCNFKLRGKESDDDEEFVKQLAERISSLFLVKHFDTNEYAKENKLSIQMAARALRYQWFRELVSEYQYDFVFTAHHADDSLETFLINLSRGTGLDGLMGIPEYNDIFIRPLLPFSKEQIVSFAKDQNLEWREDKSNEDTKYLRNKIRHEVIPSLKSLNPQFLNNFNLTLDYLKQSNQFVKSQLFFLKNDLLEISETNAVKIHIHKLREYGNPRTCLYFLLKDYGFTAWNDMEQIITAQSGKQIFSKTHRLLKDRESLLLSPLVEDISDRVYQIPEEESMIMIPCGTLKIREECEMGETDFKTIYVDRDRLKYPLTVRKWKEGDYFYPLGMKGKKKLSKFFKDEKLSLLAKERVWLLCSNKEIVWIMNYRADNRFKITPNTKNILKITIT